MQATEEDINRAAKMLAAAYWRGRLAPNPGDETPALREAISAAAKVDAPSWRASARVLLDTD
tara:strand:+ start:1987 stop:2172 length:186 start_codon:yes stop_codon:yes gene_type:complete